MAADTGAQGWWYGVRSWKVWAQGFGSGWTGIMGYGAMYWTPLIVHFILQGKLGHGTSKRDINRQGAPARPHGTGNALLWSARSWPHAAKEC